MVNKKYEGVKIFEESSEKVSSNVDLRKSNADKRRFINESICDHLRAICENPRSKIVFRRPLEFKKLTPFARQVYKAVLSIPLGEVRSYKWVAQKIGKPRAMRAVGQILKHNPWPLIIPCHRVICADGKLGGYARGEEKKKVLLDLEKQLKKDMV